MKKPRPPGPELDPSGDAGKLRCCGRKPIPYKGGPLSNRQRFCCRCDRAYDYDTGEQIPNWAWRRGADGEWCRQTGRGTA